MRKALEKYDGLRPSGDSRTVQESESKGPFSFAKENGPFGTPRERLCLAVSGLNYFDASGMQLPARGGAAFSIAIRFASAPIIRCRSAHLVEIPVYRQSLQCGERSNAAFGKQSAAMLPSLAPHDSKARLQHATKRRGSWRSHVHRSAIRRLNSSSSA